MFYLFWTGKKIPEWLAIIKFTGGDKSKRVVRHNGFGFVINRGGEYRICLISGAFCYINGAGGEVSFVGGGKGVHLMPFLKIFTKD